MSNVTVTALAFTDPRFVRLAELLALADADHARSKVEWLWLDCTTRGETSLPQWLVEQRLGVRGPDALIAAELARWSRGRGDSKSRTLYIRGAKDRTKWYQDLRDQSSKGGKARARNASRAAGAFTSKVAGSDTSPLTLTSPDLILPDLDQKKNSATPSAGGSRPRKPRPSGPTEAEKATVTRVLAKLSERSGIRYSGSTEHVRLITARLRDGTTEFELRAIVAYCADELGWQDDADMAKYLRPETLFGPKTIAKYLDPARTYVAKHNLTIQQPTEAA